jgi:hypothetical protein
MASIPPVQPGRADCPHYAHMILAAMITNQLQLKLGEITQWSQWSFRAAITGERQFYARDFLLAGEAKRLSRTT